MELIIRKSFHSKFKSLSNNMNSSAKVNEIKALNKKVIAVCRSGARSGQATSFLKQQGIDVINGGPWQNVAKFVN